MVRPRRPGRFGPASRAARRCARFAGSPNLPGEKCRSRTRLVLPIPGGLAPVMSPILGTGRDREIGLQPPASHVSSAGASSLREPMRLPFVPKPCYKTFFDPARDGRLAWRRPRIRCSAVDRAPRGRDGSCRGRIACLPVGWVIDEEMTASLRKPGDKRSSCWLLSR